MNSKFKLIYLKRKGAALIISLVFVLIFSALAVSLAGMSGTNVQIAENSRQANRALVSAHSGLEVLRYYLSNVSVDGTVSDENRLQAVSTALTTAGLSNTYDSANLTITIPAVTTSAIMLDSQSNKTFNATISYGATFETVQADITGSTPKLSRNIRTNFDFSEIPSTAFNYGVATKGPLSLSGQADVNGASFPIEASVYIEGSTSGDAFSIGSQALIAGDISIADPDATVSIADDAYVGGATGEDALAHVHTGVGYTDFPSPDPDYFRSFATGDEIDQFSDVNNHTVLDNVIIKAGTNPTFASNVTVNGILFIESPNIVSFAGKATINGMIVCDGEIGGGSGSSLSFAGQVTSNDVSILEGEQFDDIKNETGTFIIAPDASVSFSGQANIVNGAIAASGISFSGQAGGTVNGSIINYSQDPLSIGGQSSLIFNRSGCTTIPSGFVYNQTLAFQPASYSETRM